MEPSPMDYGRLVLLLSSSLFFCFGLVDAFQKPVALFAFGDSYMDTGNHNKSDPSWRIPYGMTWPGRPAGRYSNGKLLTDFIASFLNLPSPVPFELKGNHSNLYSSGVNFAYGGSGVFDTFGPQYVNFSAQINQFKGIMELAKFKEELLANSLALFSYAGNDYNKYSADHGVSLEILSLVPLVTKQIATNLRSLYGLGFRTFVVTNIEPTGCLPSITRINNYTSCNDTANVLSTYHNQALTKDLEDIQRLPGAQVIILDQYSSFNTVLSNPAHFGFVQVFEPCCHGLGNHTCGNVDAKGVAQYKLCKDPKAAFFWDNSHPTQEGWRVITEQYKEQLRVEESARTKAGGEPAKRSGGAGARGGYWKRSLINGLVVWWLMAGSWVL